MSDLQYELEVVARDHAIRNNRVVDSLDAFRIFVNRSSVTSQRYSARRITAHHFIIHCDNEKLVTMIRDKIIGSYKIMYCGETRSNRERLHAQSA